MSTSPLSFPPGFLWGAATAAYQVEGAVDEDGRGPSIWDEFSAQPGLVRNGDTGAIACDHYHRFRDDLDLAEQMGLRAYRFSVAWPRIQPDGVTVNPRGLSHYQAVAEQCLRRGITPVVTLYHWDLPQALQASGGWADRDTAARFADYAALVHQHLRDLVPLWITLNEPAVATWAGYGSGGHAPGINDAGQAVSAVHHMLLGHGLALARLREQAAPGNAFGTTLSLTVAVAAGTTSDDLAAAARLDGHVNRMFLDPLLTGRYPADMLSWYADQGAVPPVRDGDLDMIAAPLDFLGVNYYTRTHVRAATDGDAASGTAGQQAPSPDLRFTELHPRELRQTAMGWTVEPDGLHELLNRVHTDYPNLPPVYITENGAAYHDYADPHGAVKDPERVAYLDAHLRALHAAISSGVDVRGYFAWSLLDNFEWAEGYSKRFGLIHVDYPTQRRTLKSSATWYAQVIAVNGLPASGPEVPV